MSDPQAALMNFQIKGAIESIALFGGGHINDTYHVHTSASDYLLQKINTTVFHRVEALETNLAGLFRSKSEILVEHIPTDKNKWLLSDKSGAWKVQVFDKGVYAPQLASDEILVREVGKGFGRFTALSQSLPANEFEEAIPKFHSLAWRLDQLDEAIELDKAKRFETAKALIDQANDYRWINERMNDLVGQGLPTRVCHNDTKIDNILLNKGSNQFKYVIDLDTAGPGHVLYDFGDMMRTLLSPTKEGEFDESKIELRQDYFKSLKGGFLNECQSMLTSLEVESLTFGGLYMTYMMGIRFLADYLNGDTYYKINHPEENFIRARNQFKLLSLMHQMF